MTEVYWLKDRYCSCCQIMKKNIDFHDDSKKAQCKECISRIRKEGRAKLHGTSYYGENWKSSNSSTLKQRKEFLRQTGLY